MENEMTATEPKFRTSEGYPISQLIPESLIKEKIAEISEILNAKYSHEELVVIMVLKGALCFVADLIRNLHVKVSIDSVECSSYAGTMERGELHVSGLDNLNIKGKNVLVVDDIFDSGKTMQGLTKLLLEKEPKALETLVLLTKNVERDVHRKPDYSLFDIDDLFVVGYGLDFMEYYRGLPGIFTIQQPAL